MCLCLVETLSAAVFARHFFHVTLNGSRCLALAHGGWLLVELTTADFSKDACFFTGTLEATQCNVKRLVFF